MDILREIWNYSVPANKKRNFKISLWRFDNKKSFRVTISEMLPKTPEPLGVISRVEMDLDSFKSSFYIMKKLMNKIYHL